jgi:hypothetical protein
VHDPTITIVVPVGDHRASFTLDTGAEAPEVAVSSNHSHVSTALADTSTLSRNPWHPGDRGPGSPRYLVMRPWLPGRNLSDDFIALRNEHKLRGSQGSVISSHSGHGALLGVLYLCVSACSSLPRCPSPEASGSRARHRTRRRNLTRLRSRSRTRCLPNGWTTSKRCRAETLTPHSAHLSHFAKPPAPRRWSAICRKSTGEWSS